MRVLVTGGAGFVGTNLTAALLRDDADVVILDNMSRAGSERNLRWLKTRSRRSQLVFVRGDVRDDPVVRRAVDGCDAVVHLAAQVAVTTSLADPRADFETNALGTLNVLEAARTAAQPPAVLFASTNKVYGGLEDVEVAEHATRYAFAEQDLGIEEEQPLDFHSPYGCSKGAADQYVRDYARIYELPTVVFRMSCIYGPHQYGNEDQGWVAHFVRSAIDGWPVTIYGDGKQMRDVLHVDDLVSAYLTAITSARPGGRIVNLGGGPRNTLSLLELVSLLESRLDRRLPCAFADWRPGDQRVYVSSISCAAATLGWQPTISPAEGVAALVSWHLARRRSRKAA